VAVPGNHVDGRIAGSYRDKWPELFEPAVVDPAVRFLAELAGNGAALELGIGTGRLAIPLSRRGVRVHGIERSPAMVAQLRAEAGGEDIGVTVGDFATIRVDGRFRLAYLVRNTIMNLTTQDEQVACFANVAAHLEPGGCFVVEVWVPALQRLLPGETLSAPFRYVWPSELNLMARLAGMRVRERWSDWAPAPFTSDSTSHVSVWEKPA
jgi:SAM-dependent methyltransferase